MAEEKVIGIVVAVVLLSFILLLGLNTLGQVRGGIFDILQTGDEAMTKLNPLVVSDNCEAWMNAGSDKFNPTSVLETYRIPDAFAPFNGFNSCCAEELRKEAEDCLQPDSGCRAIPGDIVIECEGACNSAMLIFNYCQRQCTSDTLRSKCFDELMIETDRPCNGEPDLRYRDCETA